MTRYELHVRRNGTWVFTGYLDSKEGAVEEARTLVDRDPQVSAARVVMLENKPDGLAERPVCTILPPRDRKEPAAKPRPLTRAPRMGTGLGNGRTTRRVAPSRPWSRRERALATAVIIGALGLVAYGLAQPKQPWAFDLPDAQKPHMIRNQFTGEFSR